MRNNKRPSALNRFIGSIVAISTLLATSAALADSTAQSPPSGLPYAVADLASAKGPDKALSQSENTVVLCYKLVESTVSAQKSGYLEPLPLEGVPVTDTTLCSNRMEFSDLSPSGKPLVDGTYVVIAMLGSPKIWADLGADQIRVSVSAVSASPINPAPLRPSFGAPSPTAASNAKGDENSTPAWYYVKWPYPLQGDTVATIGVTIQVAPASPPNSPPASFSLASDPLPQVHALSRFNLSTGVVYSSVHTKSFGFNSATPAKPIVTGQNPIIDPVMFLTYYPIPFDAERDWRPSDLIPGISIGLSLSSPTSNFYIGGTSEIFRNVQLQYGFTAAKVAALAPSGTFSPAPSSSSSTPATVQRFETGGYLGLSFNITGFVSSLFKAASGS